MRTWFGQQFGRTLPVANAPMSGSTDGRFAAAVSAQGALGTFGVYPTAPPELITEQARLAAGGGQPFGIGLLAWGLADNPGQVQATIAARPALVSISFGPYEQHLAPLRDAGIITATQVGTVAEAQRADRAGVDVLIARGGEAGGHGRNAMATLPLVREVCRTVRRPVLAAGGIADAAGLTAALTVGAVGAWIGTVLLACPQLRVTPAARAAVLAAQESDTCYGRVFDLASRSGWPAEYGGRALRNAFFDRWQGREAVLARDEAAHAEYAAGVAARDLTIAAVYAGRAVGQVRDIRPVAEVLAAFRTG